MAFFNRAGSILRQTVSKHINHEMPAASPSISQMIRCMSSSKVFVGARVIMDRETGRSRGFGFVTFTDSEAASAAIQTTDQQTRNYGSLRELPASCKSKSISSVASAYREFRPGYFLGAQPIPGFSSRGITTLDDASTAATEVAPRIKFKRLDKTARHIMQILDKEAVEDVCTQREIPDIRPGYIIQLRLEVPENKRRVSTVKGIVIARRNAGLNTTIRLRRLVAGVGVESLLPLYSPNVKEIKVLDKKKVRRAKLYYLRDKMNALRK